MQHRSRLGAAALALMAWSATAGVAPAAAQLIDQWQNAPQPPEGRQVVPFMEGWYDNGDGTYTISFGYLNRNQDQLIDIPIGENNYIEPAEYDGVQPTHFLGSRHRGMFAVTIPASARDQDIWWHISPGNGQTYSVPGRTSAPAYQLDWSPRPHGSLSPRAWFDSERNAAQGPAGIWSSRSVQTAVGQPVTLTVNVHDPSEHDPEDRRMADGVPIRVVWSKYQGPVGEVTFARHPSSPEPVGGGRGGPPGPEVVTINETRGVVRVNVTFSTPGEYVIQAQVDNWGAPDSSAGDQCCWTNAFQRVVVTQ